MVVALKCSVCVQLEEKLQGCRNFNRFINGSKNLRASSFQDHARCDMHLRAMSLLQQSQSTDPTTYAPIAKAVMTLDGAAEAKVKKKFDIAYFLCKERMAFHKMEAICILQETHGVDLGTGYKNEKACASFTRYIGQSLKESLTEELQDVKFFSIQTDGSSDAANIEEELFLVLYCDPHSCDRKLHVRSRFLAVLQPKSVNATGLFDCFSRAMGDTRTNWKQKLIGIGCDGANVNMGDNGLKGKIKEHVPWIVLFWCLAHCLEIALKDALANTFFSSVDELLLRLYYLYEKSGKKCRELEYVVQALKQCLESSEMPSTGGNRPLRACGTRFIAHKVAALSRIVDRFGAYLSHLQTLIEDPSTKGADKARLTGYVRRWRSGKMLVACAFFHGILMPAAKLCKALQNDEICVVSAVEAMIDAAKSIRRLETTALEELSTVKKVVNRMNHAEGVFSYQEVEVVSLEDGLEYFRTHQREYINKILTCIKSRITITAHHTQLLTSAVTILATHGWEKSDRLDFGDSDVELLANQFQVPLRHASVDTDKLLEEWHQMRNHAKRYINLCSDYASVWYKLFNVADAKRWSNILDLVELLFCLPMSNGRVERTFSQMKLIKIDRRCNLSETSLDSLLRIEMEGPEFSAWDSSRAVRLWWTDACRRQVQDSRAAPNSSLQESGNEEAILAFDLDDWESLLV